MATVEIRAERPDHAQVAPLLEALDAYLYEQYPVLEFPADVNHILAVSELLHPSITFLVAWGGDAADRQALGCGAVRRLSDSQGAYAEIKRMYVRPIARGQGVAELVLTQLEATVRSEGIQRILLETGTRQPEAIRLYQRCGYAICQRFGDYKNGPVSVFMEKQS